MISSSSLVVGKHVIEGVIELIRGPLDLQLLSVNFILDVVNPLIELSDVHLSILKSSLCDLVFVLKRKDFLNQLLFSLKSLLSGFLKLFHVLTNSLKFFFNSLQVLLSKFSSLKSSLQLRFLDSKLPAEFIKLLLIINGHLNCCSQILVKLFKGDFIVHAGAFNNLDSLEDIVSSLGSESKLGDSGAKIVGGFLVFLLHQHDPTSKSCNISLNFLELLVSFFQRFTGLGEFVVCLIITDLKVLNFLSQITDVTVSLIRTGGGFSSCFLKSSDGCVQTIGLTLQRLHLLSDGIHGVC